MKAIKNWFHYLSARRFTIVTDQQAVPYMFHSEKLVKIKNNKIQRWWMELGCYDYAIMYCPGKNNIPAGTLLKAHCRAMFSKEKLYELNLSLCHPGITRLIHFVKIRNLPYSIEEVKRMCTECLVFSWWEPRFHSPESLGLVKATQPMEPLSMDFKGPLPSNTKN